MHPDCRSGGGGGLDDHTRSHPARAGFSRKSASFLERPLRAAGRVLAMPILQAPALPVVAPAAVGQGPVAADTLHLRLPTLLRTTLAAAAARGSELACLQRARPGRGRRTVPFAPPPGGDPPPASGSANGGDPRAAGTRARRGPLPRARVPRGRGCCSQNCLFIYFRCVLYVAIATVPSFPESQGHRCFQTFPGQGLLRGFPFFCRGRRPG